MIIGTGTQSNASRFAIGEMAIVPGPRERVAHGRHCLSHDFMDADHAWSAAIAYQRRLRIADALGPAGHRLREEPRAICTTTLSVVGVGTAQFPTSSIQLARLMRDLNLSICSLANTACLRCRALFSAMV